MMQSLIKVPEVASTMREMSKEMMKVSTFKSFTHNLTLNNMCNIRHSIYDLQAGIIEEMMDETLDTVTGIDEDDMEEEIQKEVDKVGSSRDEFVKLSRIS